MIGQAKSLWSKCSCPSLGGVGEGGNDGGMGGERLFSVTTLGYVYVCRIVAEASLNEQRAYAKVEVLSLFAFLPGGGGVVGILFLIFFYFFPDKFSARWRCTNGKSRNPN